MMRLNAEHGDRLAPADLTELVDDLIGCTIGDDLLGTTETLAPLDPLPCPVTIAWSERDRVFPLEEYGPRARERVPGARFMVLRGVGHAPMIDAPDLVAQTLLECAGGAAHRPLRAQQAS
jgi:pimeloyl-ACP methyl ester carboxylesterase